MADPKLSNLKRHGARRAALDVLTKHAPNSPGVRWLSSLGNSLNGAHEPATDQLITATLIAELAAVVDRLASAKPKGSR